MTTNHLMDSEAGRQALEALRPRLDRLAELRRITADTERIAILAAAVGTRVRQPQVRERFARLPGSEFEFAHVDDLLPAAQALMYASLRHGQASAGVSRARELFDQGVQVKQRMIAVLSHYLGSAPDMTSKLAELSQGDSMSLAEDLWRLSALYRDHRAALAAEGRFYRARDQMTASNLAQRIHAEIGGEAQRWAEVVQRAFTFLMNTYDEVSAAGRWLFRRDDPETMFPCLLTAARGTRHPGGGPGHQAEPVLV